MSIQAKQQVFMKERPSTQKPGTTYKSGWITTKELLVLANLAESAGLNAVGFSYEKTGIKSAKFNGDIIAMTPFKLSGKSA